jgi:hypothetical protein
MPTIGNGTTPAKAFLEAPVPDVLLEQGRRPKVDPAREYVAGGGGGFPLVGQQVLAKGVDDLSRDLGLNVYEAMLHDSTVASAVAILITGVLSGEFQLLPAIRADATEIVAPGSDRERDINLAQEIRDFCQRNIDRLNQPIKMICHELLYAMVLGCKLAEKVFEQGEGEDADKLVLKIVRTKRNAAWEFVVEPTGDVVAIRAMTFDLGQRDLPPEKFLIVSWMPRDGDPRGRSILRPAYNGWNLKINLFKHYNKYLEKFGCPTIIGVTSPDARDEVELTDNGVPTGRMITPTEAMAQMLARLDGGSYAAVPYGASIHPIQPNNNGNAFLQAFQLFKTEILEAILITSRSVMPARHSSKADSETAQDTVGQILLYGREMLEDVFHDQLFWQLVMINYGKDKADLYTPHVSLGAVEHQDIATVAVAYHAIGYAIDPMQLPAIDAKLGLPVRKPSELTIEEADGNPVGFSGNGAHGSDGVPDHVLAQAMRVLDVADRRLSEEDAAAFNCGTGAGGFKEGNTCQPHAGGGGGGGGGRKSGGASPVRGGGRELPVGPLRIGDTLYSAQDVAALKAKTVAIGQSFTPAEDWQMVFRTPADAKETKIANRNIEEGGVLVRHVVAPKTEVVKDGATTEFKMGGRVEAITRPGQGDKWVSEVNPAGNWQGKVKRFPTEAEALAHSEKYIAKELKSRTTVQSKDIIDTGISDHLDYHQAIHAGSLPAEKYDVRFHVVIPEAHADPAHIKAFQAEVEAGG